MATEPWHTYLSDYCAVDLEGVIAAGFKLSI